MATTIGIVGNNRSVAVNIFDIENVMASDRNHAMSWESTRKLEPIGCEKKVPNGMAINTFTRPATTKGYAWAPRRMRLNAAPHLMQQPLAKPDREIRCCNFMTMLVMMSMMAGMSIRRTGKRA